MSIIQYKNRNLYKHKRAIQLIFHKSTNYRLTPGYHSMDVCIVGGGAAGITPGILNISTPSGDDSSGTTSIIQGRGGAGGFVRNLYKKECPQEFYIQIGPGGIAPSTGWDPSVELKVNKYQATENGHKVTRRTGYINDSQLGGGGQTYIKDLATNNILYSVPGGTNWYQLIIKGSDTDDTAFYPSYGFTSGISNMMGRISSHWSDRASQLLNFGGNLGGGIPTSYMKQYTSNGKINYIYEHVTTPYSGCIKGIYHTNYRGKISNIMYFTVTCSLGGKVQYQDNRPQRTILVAFGNDTIDIEGYGETRIFTDGDYLAGGGCACDTIGSNMSHGSSSTNYTNSDGGGDSAIIYRHNDSTFWLTRNPGNGKPNTGGGGAGGVRVTSNTYQGSSINMNYLSKGGDGGSGLVVMRCYPDEKRPDVQFVDGLNSYIIE